MHMIISSLQYAPPFQAPCVAKLIRCDVDTVTIKWSAIAFFYATVVVTAVYQLACNGSWMIM